MRYGLLYTFLILIAVVIVVIIFATVGFNKVVSKFWEVGPVGFLTYLSASIIIVLLPTIGWWLILHSHEIKSSFLHTTIGQLMGNAISYITPSMYIGGEPVKSYYIGTLYNTSKTKVFSTAIFGKFQELVSLLIFIYAGTIVMIIEAQEVQLPKGIWTALLVVDIFLGLIVLLSLRSIIKNSPLLSNIVLWFGRKGIFTRFMENLSPKIIKTENLIYQAFRHNWRAGAIAFIFSFISIAVVFIRPAIFFYFLYQKNIFSLTEIAVIFTLSQVLLVIQITPGCIGTFEGGMIGIFALVGIDAVDAVSYLLVCRFVDLLFTGSGIYLAIHYNLVNFISPRIETVTSTAEIEAPNNFTK
ncbi:MAG: lysylphosphatidylglycerol synthase transmembrane domain-containing protein [Planctomycetota bacterium]|nr:lysylphosphatidylglycerol synthase transmembrane domain-containing protein [Planctomycetota bacterium]MDI6787266.1 lysylphosphatidylglycerol synthase transmembrane domain-containing protein [Planctomycetota bacterium]